MILSGDMPSKPNTDYKQELALRFAAETENRRNDKLQRCLGASLKQFTSFLDDPTKVQRYNAHIDKLMEHYGSEVPTAYELAFMQALKIDPQKIEAYKKIGFSNEITNNPFIARLEKGSNCLLFNRSIIDQFSDEEMQKIDLYEIKHAVVIKNLADMAHIENDKANNNDLDHMHALACHTFSDAVQIWPKFSAVDIKLNALSRHSTAIKKIPANTAYELFDAALALKNQQTTEHPSAIDWSAVTIQESDVWGLFLQTEGMICKGIHPYAEINIPLSPDKQIYQTYKGNKPTARVAPELPVLRLSSTPAINLT